MRPHALNDGQSARPPRRTRGTTMIEMMIVLVTMTAVLGGSMLLLESARKAWRFADTEGRLQENGRRILQNLLGELRHSGLTSLAGTNYPAIYERPRGPDTTPRGNLIATMNYADESLVSEVYASQGVGSDRILRNEARVSNELVYQRPLDVDGNGTPLDANGDLEWGNELFSYRVVEDPNGIPWLYRYTTVNGAQTDSRIVGPSVRAVTFDVVFNDRSLRFDELAVVIYLEELDDSGQLITTAVEGVVGLRNTREL